MRNTPKTIFNKKKHHSKVTVLTAYDYPFAKILDDAGIDIILVGDSLGMVVLGYSSTRPVTMADMIHHTRAVARAVKQALIVSDMPYRSYGTPAEAIKNARLLIQAGARAVKLEGGKKIRKQLTAILKAGIPLMGHVGMLPQSVERPGGYRVQGRDPKQAEKIFEDALILDRLGAFAMVLECVPAALGARISRAVECPTIGIGAGLGTDGQVLVLHDMLGFEGKVRPRFVRPYGRVAEETRDAVRRYREEVQSGKFPSEEESY